MEKVTDSEMDGIADNMTAAENRILRGDVGPNGEDAAVAPSLYEKLWSNHRTILFGNYSLETMEIALRRRGVDLTWVNPNSGTDVAEMGAGMGNGEAGEKLLAGYIVNAPKDGDASWWRFDRYLRYVPLARRIVTGGRHWFAITRLERVRLSSGTACCYRGEGNKKEGQWTVIDSDKSDIRYLSSKGELQNYLCGLWETGGQIFQATLEFKTAEMESSE